MKKTSLKKPLKLDIETVRPLTETDLQHINGGQGSIRPTTITSTLPFCVQTSDRCH